MSLENSVISQNIAFQGLKGSFTYLAALRSFGTNAKLEGQKSFKDIFSKVTDGSCQLGIAPLENSLAGSVQEVFDLLWEFNLKIINETYLRISHNLLAPKSRTGTIQERLNKIKRVFSHPKALEQCMNFLEKHPEIEKNFFSDTAGAADYISYLNDPETAAIASTEAAELYNLDILCPNLEDNPRNFTRFIVIAPPNKAPKEKKDVDKGSIIFTLPHVPSSLFKALETISINEINVLKIESRPIHGKPFEYLFYIDFEFNPEHFDIANHALENLKTKTLSLRNLGFYKAAKREF